MSHGSCGFFWVVASEESRGGADPSMREHLSQSKTAAGWGGLDRGYARVRQPPGGKDQIFNHRGHRVNLFTDL